MARFYVLSPDWGEEICSAVRYWATQRLPPGANAAAGCSSKSKTNSQFVLQQKQSRGMKDFPALAEGQEGKL